MSYSRLGKYHLIACLSRGSASDVYLAAVASPLGVNKLLVVKELRPELAEEPEFLHMFLDEARLSARLNHANVAQTVEVDAIDGRYFIAMEYIEGVSLHHLATRAAKAGGLPLPIALRIVCDALAGLHHAHELRDYDGTPLGLVHRDVTPGNILVAYNGQTKLVDFGIAKATLQSDQTRIGMIKGKAGYMAPEQALSQPLDRRADVFAIGAVLWELVARQRLRRGSTDVDPLAGLLRPAPPLRSVVPDAPPELERICERALAQRPEQRYATAAAVFDELNAFAARNCPLATLNAVNAYISELFRDERASVASLVAKRMRDLSRGDSDEDDPTRLTSRGDRSARAPLVALPSVPPEPTSVSLAPRGEHQPRPGRFVIGAAVLVASFAGAYAFRHQYQASLQAPAPTTATSVTSHDDRASGEAAASGTAIDAVDLYIDAQPREARILVDGVEVKGNPYRQQYPRDGASHDIEIQMDGFESHHQAVTFKQDVMLIIGLKRAPTRGAPAPRVDRAPKPSTSSGGAPQARPIDTANPWDSRSR